MAEGRIIWHVGPQKTGTTSFQQLLRLNKDVLRPYLTSVVHSHGTKRATRAAISVQHQPTDDTRSALADQVAALIDAWQSSPTPSPVLIVSDEQFLGMRLFDDGPDIFSASHMMLPLLAECSAMFSPSFVLYQRDMQKWLTSAYQQSVKQAVETRTISEWMEAVPFSSDWEQIKPAIITSTNAPVRFYNFDEEAKSNDPLGASILRDADVPNDVIADLERPGRLNESLPSGAIAFMREMNAVPMNPRIRGAIRKNVVQNAECFRSDVAI